MKSIEDLEREMFIFGSIFLLSNKLQTVIDHGLSEYGLTAKQWFLMATLEEFFPEPPTIKAIADMIGSSHQNVKQLALKLEKNGFVKLEKDEKDKRAMKVILTEKSMQLGKSRNSENIKFFSELFSSVKEKEIQAMYEGFRKLIHKVNDM